MAGFGIDGDTPRVAEAIGPSFGDDSFVADEGIVMWDAVVPSGGRMIDVEAKDFGGELRQILAAKIGVGVAGAVAGGDVEHSVETEFEIATVMAIRFPGDDFEGRVFVEHEGLAVHGVAGDDRPL